MSFRLTFMPTARTTLDAIEADPSQARKLKKIRKALAFMENDPRHRSLQTHKYVGWFVGDAQVFEAYVENNTPGAWRIFWHYGPGKGTVTILVIGPHPD